MAGPTTSQSTVEVSLDGEPTSRACVPVRRSFCAPDRVRRLGPPLRPQEATYATVYYDERDDVVSVQVTATAQRAGLAEERVIEREMRTRGVVREQLDGMAYLELSLDVHDRLAERRLARAYRPVAIRARRRSGVQHARQTRRARRAAVRRATTDSGGDGDGDGEPPRRPIPRARGPPPACRVAAPKRQAFRSSRSGCVGWARPTFQVVEPGQGRCDASSHRERDVSTAPLTGTTPLLPGVTAQMHATQLLVCPQLARLLGWRAITLR